MNYISEIRELSVSFDTLRTFLDYLGSLSMIAVCIAMGVGYWFLLTDP